MISTIRHTVLGQLRNIAEFIFAALYALFINLFDKKPRRIVLYFHGVNRADVIGFTKQVAYLAKKCFVVKPSKITNIDANGAKIVAAITFDDAFVSIIENAVPILREHRLPAGIFVATGNLGQPPCWEMPENCSDKDETVMTQEQIAELDNDGFEIFSHTVSHPVLTQVEDRRLETELVDSKRALEEIVGHRVTGISYPYGAHDAKVCEIAQKAGYGLGFTIEPTMVDSRTDCLQIGRFRVSPSDSLMKFRLKVHGAYQVTSHLRRLKRRLFKK